MSEEYTPPEVQLGDTVYWYHDPLSPGEPTLGWICRRPGAQTVSILVFAPNVGFLEKPSVRHVSDPGLRDNAGWRQWGCWDFSNQTKLMRRLESATTDVIANSERQARKAVNGKQ